MNSKFREPVSGLPHLGAAAFFALGTVVMLILGRADLGKVIALLIYGASLVLMFSSSATYHMVQTNPQRLLRWRKLDHSSIYILIAGSYTPICLYFFQGFFQWGLLAIIWTIAVAGVIVKLFVINAPRWITAGIYLVMGWLSLMAVGEIMQRMPAAAITWLVAGGLFYTVGAVIYIAKKPDFFPGAFGFHELWHIFVILGALSHFILVAVFVAGASPAP